LVKYRLKITPQAFRDIDMIYDYIARHLLEPGTANNLVDEIEAGIFSLEEMPNRGAPRRIGNYANKGYRQLFIKNYTIVYRVDETEKQVIIVTVKYSVLASGGNRQNKFIENRQNWIIEKDQTTQFWLIS
jgi:addiction module RelE/StbE family toxin